MKKLENLLKKMSLDQKIGQLLQLNSSLLNREKTNIVTGPQQKLGLTPEMLQCCGSVLNFDCAESMIALQKAHLEQDPLGIPMLFMMDVIHGCRTIFPIPLAMGCTFDTELVKKCVTMSAKEAAASGVHVAFSPMLDLVRDARWGRVMESTGEDPYLNARMGEAFVKGFQSDILDRPEYIPACVKHFAAYGAAEAGRDYNTVDMSEHVLREYYLPAYKAAIDAGALLVMPSFNTIGGTPSVANKHLLRDILRDEWGFDGVVISDYAAIREMRVHGYVETDKEGALKAMEAGCDIEMMSGAYPKHLKELVEEGKVSMEQIDRAVMRVLRLKDKLGLFENPYRYASAITEKVLSTSFESRSLVRKAAAEAAVLLKNDGVLPFSKDVKSVAIVGPFAEEKGIKGFWSCYGKDEDCVSVAEGVRAKLPDADIVTAKGCSHELLDRDTSGVDEAAKAAAGADIAILCIGEYQNHSGEGNSRADISLPYPQRKLAEAVLAANPNTAVLLFTGRPLAIPELGEAAPAILNMWQPGTEGGNAAADLLFGDAAPGGRLAMSFPYMTGQCPVYYNHMNTGRPLKKDFRTAAYCSRYQDCPNDPLYPFGFGLTYTTFEYGEIKLSADSMKPDGKITASVTVTNTGDRDGAEVVQLYLRDNVASLVRPVKELKGYQKIFLRKGESREVSFEITDETLRFWRADGTYGSEPGEFSLALAPSSAAPLTNTFRLD